MSPEVIRIATRGSALALAQAHQVRDQCITAFPQLEIRIEIFKTTGDRRQTASFGQRKETLPKGLFTKELEIALLENRADLAVHSLKDLPTELPSGLCLGAVPERADPRDVLIRRGPRHGDDGLTRSESPGASATDPGLGALRSGATVGTGSTRRRAQLLEIRHDLRIVEIRGNVNTRLQKLATGSKLDAIVLAAAGLSRLGIEIRADGGMLGNGVPEDLLAAILEPETMLPCVGQGALGLETRSDDDRLISICHVLDHPPSHRRAIAERSFLMAMGGGCQSPVAAHAEEHGQQLRLRAVTFGREGIARGEISGPVTSAALLGAELGAQLRGKAGG